MPPRIRSVRALCEQRTPSVVARVPASGVRLSAERTLTGTPERATAADSGGWRSSNGVEMRERHVNHQPRDRRNGSRNRVPCGGASVAVTEEVIISNHPRDERSREEPAGRHYSIRGQTGMPVCAAARHRPESEFRRINRWRAWRAARLVGALPGESGSSTTEVAVGRRLRVDRTLEVEVAMIAAGRRSNVSLIGRGDLGRIGRLGAERLDEQAHRPACRRVGDLHLDLAGEASRPRRSWPPAQRVRRGASTFDGPCGERPAAVRA